MRTISGFIFLICLTFALPLHAETVLYRYFDKDSGDERGLCYSDVNGKSAVVNSDWKSEIISEDKKEYYSELHKSQIKKQQEKEEQALKQKKEKARSKLASLGLTPDEIEAIVK